MAFEGGCKLSFLGRQQQALSAIIVTLVALWFCCYSNLASDSVARHNWRE
jgi:hypothetical protein